MGGAINDRDARSEPGMTYKDVRHDGVSAGNDDGETGIKWRWQDTPCQVSLCRT